LSLSRVIFPLRTNIKSLQRWGDNDISKKIKQSFILYDEVIFEAGTFRFSGAERFVLEGYVPWSEENSKEAVLRDLEKIENRQEAGYITVLDGKTHAEKHKHKVEKKNEFVADFRVVDVLSELESGSYGKEVDFVKYAVIEKTKDYWNTINENTAKDLANAGFADLVRMTYGPMLAIRLLNNLNDSLAISHFFKVPVTLDAMHTTLLKSKTQSQVGLDFSILDRLAQFAIPDFGDFSIEKLLKLRKHRAIQSFRKLIAKISSEIQSGSSLNIEALYNQELLKQIKEIAPSGKEVALDVCLGALSSIPNPLVSISATIADIGKGVKEYNDFAANWLSFILTAREQRDSQ
jgi:hypothetical protein